MTSCLYHDDAIFNDFVRDLQPWQHKLRIKHLKMIESKIDFFTGLKMEMCQTIGNKIIFKLIFM